MKLPWHLLPCLLILAIPHHADACMASKRLKMVKPGLSDAMVQKLSHDTHARTQIAYSLDKSAPCINGFADIFPCRNIDLLSYLSTAQLGGGFGNDLWGWEDPETGEEWAIMGLTNGTAFVNVSDPENPVFVGRLPSHEGQVSTWRDIGVYENHAYIVADNVTSHGLQVFDLTQLRDHAGPSVTFTATSRYTGFNEAHNIAINNDSGFGYVVGSNLCSGGLLILDLSQPSAPSFSNCFSSDGYTHDAQCVNYNGPDADHQGDEICFASNEDTLTIVDVTNKLIPQQLSRTGFAGAGYLHQGWLSADQRYFVMDDELDEMKFKHNTRTYTWDVSDLDNPVLVGHHESTNSAIDHNQFIRDGHTYQANYSSGMRILELTDPSSASLSEVALIDTHPETDSTEFKGAWSTYPFFKSGIVLISDINRGLFVVKPTFNLGDLFDDGFEVTPLSSPNENLQ